VSDKLEYYTGLASSWAVDPSTKTVFIKLNPNARWSDSEAVTTGAYFIKGKDIKKGTSVTFTHDSAKILEAFKKGDIDQLGLNLAELYSVTDP